jgi:hypothetical protein
MMLHRDVKLTFILRKGSHSLSHKCNRGLRTPEKRQRHDQKKNMKRTAWHILQPAHVPGFGKQEMLLRGNMSPRTIVTGFMAFRDYFGA